MSTVVIDVSVVSQLLEAVVELGLVPSELEVSGSEVLSLAGVESVDPAVWQEVRRELLTLMARVARSAGRHVAGECRRCGQPIRWSMTERGKRMMLDPLPYPMGNVVIRSGTAVVKGNNQLPLPAPAYRAHAATCPVTAHRGSVVELAARRACVVCKYRLDQLWVAQGLNAHPTCRPPR